MTDQSITPCPLSFKGIPYSDIINRWFSLAGGEPVEGERNDKLHRLASHCATSRTTTKKPFCRYAALRASGKGNEGADSFGVLGEMVFGAEADARGL